MEIKKPKVEKADLTFVDTRIAQKTAGRAKRSMVRSPFLANNANGLAHGFFIHSKARDAQNDQPGLLAFIPVC